MKQIAYINSPFPEKFGIPRQSNIVSDITSTIVFEPDYRNPDALRGIEEFDYIWLIWQFSENLREGWSPTVRPPRLGGNKRMGVFATRSSFRPNALALSSVRLIDVKLHTAEGPLLYVAGADLLDGTPIFDIKPYLPYTDSHPEARSGFAPTPSDRLLDVECPERLAVKIPVELQSSLFDLLANDPRPSYHDDPERVYGMRFWSYNVKFSVDGKKLTIVDII